VGTSKKKHKQRGGQRAAAAAAARSAAASHEQAGARHGLLLPRRHSRRVPRVAPRRSRPLGHRSITTTTITITIIDAARVEGRGDG